MPAKMVSVYSVGNAELLAYAQNVLGLPVDASTPHKALIAQVVEVSGAKEIPLQDTPAAAQAQPHQFDDDEDEADEPAPVVELTDAQRAKRDAQTVLLTIAKQQNVAGGDEDVPLMVNGSLMLVRRGEPQAVPMPWFRVLESAVQEIYEPLENGGISSTPNKVPLYPYTVHVANSY